MTEFHFLRPWWLLALPVGLWIIWRLASGGGGPRGSWRAVVDPALQPYVLARPSATADRRLPMIAAALAWLVGVFALSGPTWERVPVPAFRSDEALVVAFDLSRSMDAADVEPSRLVQARLKLLALLDLRESGQTGLVVFSSHAFTVTPLTSDTRTIASLVGALSTDIMPSRGSLPEAGLAKAAELLRQAGMTAGEILLISDSGASPRGVDLARGLRDEGYRVHVLAVGTREGAPIRERQGGFVTDSRGEVVIPGTDLRELRRLADAGGGRFARLTIGDADLETLFPARPAAAAGVSVERESEDGEEYRADVWRDQGVWLTLLLLPLAALSFRRGWLCAWLLVALIPLPPAHAFEWSDLWQRRDQQGLEALQGDAPDRAAALFEDPEWRAAALYRSGDYERSATVLDELDTPQAHYNRGNALARAGQLEQALTAYDRSLELAPDHEDARYNRDLVRELLEEQNENQSARDPQSGEDRQSGEDQQSGEGQQADDPSSQASNDPSGRDGEPQGGESQSDPAGGARDDPAERTADGADEADERRDGEGGSDAAAEEPEPRQADAGSGQDDPGEQAEGEPRDAGSGPEDLERWASEQAADQWLRRIPQDPGGLLRRKFLYQYQRLGSKEMWK